MLVLEPRMDAMERLRGRLQVLLDERTPAGKIRQKALARHLKKSEAWLSNILSGKRGMRLVDLDHIAEFLHIPASELIREAEAELIEATPTEQALLRKFRRGDANFRNAVLVFSGLPTHTDTSAEGWAKTTRLKRTRKPKREKPESGD